MPELRAGVARAVLAPAQGAAFLRLDHGDRALLAPVPRGGDPNRGAHGAFVMAPWTNRLDRGRITVGGVRHAMALNRPEEGTAIHGFLRDRPWRLDSASRDAARLSCAFDLPPFRGTAAMEVRLAPDRLDLMLALTNDAAEATPMGIGWHPWFSRPPGTRLRFAAATVFGRDARGIAAGPHPTAGLDGDEAVLDGLDTHFAGWDGAAEIAWPDGGGLALRAEGAWAANLQVYAPRDGATLCVEPVSHVPDAPNRPEAGAHGPMHILPPGGRLEGGLALRWR